MLVKIIRDGKVMLIKKVRKLNIQRSVYVEKTTLELVFWRFIFNEKNTSKCIEQIFDFLTTRIKHNTKEIVFNYTTYKEPPGSTEYIKTMQIDIENSKKKRTENQIAEASFDLKERE